MIEQGEEVETSYARSKFWNKEVEPSLKPYLLWHAAGDKESRKSWEK